MFRIHQFTFNVGDKLYTAAREYRLSQLQAYLDYASDGEDDFPIRRFTERESAATQAVGYGKTMMVFHMASRLLGEDTFINGLRRFYDDYLFEEANWDDLIHSFETASDRSLSAWFEQWIGRPGAPILSVARIAGGDDETVRLVEVATDPHLEWALGEVDLRDVG